MTKKISLSAHELVTREDGSRVRLLSPVMAEEPHETERQLILRTLERHALNYGACVARERSSADGAELRVLATVQATRRLLSAAERLYQYDAEVHPA